MDYSLENPSNNYQNPIPAMLLERGDGAAAVDGRGWPLGGAKDGARGAERLDGATAGAVLGDGWCARLVDGARGWWMVRRTSAFEEKLKKPIYVDQPKPLQN